MKRLVVLVFSALFILSCAKKTTENIDNLDKNTESIKRDFHQLNESLEILAQISPAIMQFLPAFTNFLMSLQSGNPTEPEYVEDLGSFLNREQAPQDESESVSEGPNQSDESQEPSLFDEESSEISLFSDEDSL